MPSFNRTIIVGHLTRDPALKNLQGGSTLAEFGIACNRKYKTSSGEQREDVLFIDCTAFGKTSEIINQYSKKGDAMLVEGRLKLDQWDDKQTGAKRSKISLIVENFQFIGGQKTGDDAPPERQSRGPSQRPPAQSEPPYQPTGLDDSDIPFAWSGRSGQPL